MTIKVSKPSINLREALSDLKQDTGLKGQELMRADTVAEARTAIGAGRKNLIINGGFDVWQRGTSFSSPATAKYTADRWKVMGTVTTVSKVTNGLSITATSSDSFMQDIEAMNVKAGNYIFSFTADDYSKINSIGCYSMGGGDHYGLATKLSDGVYSINLAEVNRAGSSVRFEFYLAVGTVVLSNVQLELGSVATDFEHRSYGEELALCQRYYEVVCKLGSSDVLGTANDWPGSQSYVPFGYKVEKRVMPTMVNGGTWYIFDAGGAHTGGSTTGAVGTKRGELVITGLSRNGFVRAYSSGYLYLDAEL